MLLLLAVAVLLAGGVAAVRGQFAPNADKTVGNFQDLLPSTPTITTEEAKAQYGKLPMSCVANQGQTDSSVNFVARGAGYSLFLKPTEAVFAMSRKKDTAKRGVNEQPWQMGQPKSEMTKTETAVLRMKLAGANADSPSEGLKEQEGKVNYFIGNDESKWQTNISTFAKVKYQDVYAGIDLIFYGNQQQLEYDFIVAPNADYKQIRLNFGGAKRVEIEKTTGDLLLHTRLGTMRQHQPLVYQELGGERQKIAGRYVRRGKQIGFEVGKYDTTLPLVIDPTLVYSTFIGGSSEDRGNAITVDSTGNTYIIGTTLSPNFPTTPGAFQTTLQGNGQGHVFVTKLNASGSGLIYSTFIGGSGGEAGNGIAIDSTGNAYLTGSTASLDFPTTPGAFSTTLHGNGSVSDVFVTKLNASGSALIYSTFIGGLGNDNGTGIAIDSTGNAYLTGVAAGFAPIYPTTGGAFQTTHMGGIFDVFVTKLNASGSALIYSTLIGGGGNDTANGIAIDSIGNAYVTGQTGGFAPLYPTTPGAFQRTLNSSSNVFVTKLNASGSALIYSTFIGGSGIDFGNGIAIDPTGNAYLTGSTSSVDFPTTPGAFQTTNQSNVGFSDVFVTKLNAGGSALIYSTYIGGVLNDIGNGVAIDSTGNAYVTGSTASPAYPTTAGAFQTTRSGSQDVFFTKLNAGGSALIYSTYVGGSNDDVATGIAIDSTGDAYVTGYTLSTNYPTTAGAFDTTHNGGGDVFVTKIAFQARPATLGDISTRLEVGSADRVMIAGFIVQGNAPKRVLIRAAGPSLTQFGVPNALANPRLELHDTANTIGMNDNWQTTQVGGVITADQVAEIQNSGLAPRDPAESAIIATLPPGSYTAIVQGVNGGTGVGIVEAYDLDATSGSLLANIATRGFVQTGDNAMIGGFIVVSQPTRVIIRAIGPSLTQFGVPDALANPQLELHDATSTIAQNNDWQTTQIGGIITSDQVAAIQNSQLAPTNSAESAIIVTLQPGSYTAIVSGFNNTTGNALVEVYNLP